MNKNIILAVLLLTACGNSKIKVGDCVKHIENEETIFTVHDTTDNKVFLEATIGFFIFQRWIPKSKVTKVKCVIGEDI